MQTPLLIQWLSSFPLGSGTRITKFDEWPVVARTPRRSLVLNKGQLWGEGVGG